MELSTSYSRGKPARSVATEQRNQRARARSNLSTPSTSKVNQNLHAQVPTQPGQLLLQADRPDAPSKNPSLEDPAHCPPHSSREGKKSCCKNGGRARWQQVSELTPRVNSRPPPDTPSPRTARPGRSRCAWRCDRGSLDLVLFGRRRGAVEPWSKSKQSGGRKQPAPEPTELRWW